ncbi:hypothetical protein JCM3774_006267 [Rhodotorula dairenensis]
MRRRVAYPAEDDDASDASRAAILDETEQEAVVRDLLREASKARQVYLVGAFLLNLIATFTPLPATPAVLSIMIRLSSMSMAARFALTAAGFDPPERIPVDAILVAAPAVNALRAAHSCTTEHAHLVWAAPIACQVLGILLAGAGESLVRDATGLEHLKYASPGA